jgi:hypothetical protein
MGVTHRFKDPALAANFVNKNVEAALYRMVWNKWLAGLLSRQVSRPAGRLAEWLASEANFARFIDT